jgi:murein DD-endopeptidase MepM/ murein hydrolase activator NlpD
VRRGYAPPRRRAVRPAETRCVDALAAHVADILMSAFPSHRPRRKLPFVIALLVIVAVALAAGGLYLRPRFESEAPQISVSPGADVMGLAPLEIRVADKGTGLKAMNATLTQGGTQHNLGAEQFAQPQAEKTLSVALAKVTNLKEGPATLRVTARDASLFNGNESVFEKNITIDITPPTLDLVADDRYVNFGGVGVVVYKVSADTATSGVKIGEHFFPGFGGVIKDKPDHHLALFAHAYDIAPEVRPVIVATDKAGNTRELKLAYELKNVRYKKSTIAVSESFLQNKVAPLLVDAATRSGSPKDVFVAVNKALRKDNEAKIAEITKKASPTMLWKDAFVQLPNSKVEANFADQRTYMWNGEAIDNALHLGYDLSVTKNIPVEAANAGTVVFAGDLGIYGGTVIVDHGLGLFTLYSHLSAIDAKVGETLAKRQILGKSGETGLAAGDHLHYGVYVAGVAVLPVEWWDQKWIDDNIAPKLEGRSGQEIAEAQQSSKGARKAAGKTGGKRRR